MIGKIFIVLGIVVALAGGALLYFKDRRYVVVIGQEQIDAGLAKMFPITKHHLLIFSITYSNPRVTLLEDEDRVQVGMDATLNIRIGGESREFAGTCTITSGVRYDPESFSFYLADVWVENLAIQGIPERYLERVTPFASLAARDLIESRPVYRLRAKDAKTSAAQMVLKDVEVRGRSVRVSLGI